MEYKEICGCLFEINLNKLPIYERPLCPKCMKPLGKNNENYFCPICGFEIASNHLAGAIARDKARIGIG